jgi:uncharacterized protein (DUF2252 family)
MIATGTVIERSQEMKSRQTPRSEQSSIGDVDRDPIELLKINSAGRVERLIPLRYGRMLASPFAFYRGSAILQAHDLAGTANSGIVVQVCGDCHLCNFGGFATPERKLLFDINDFDETSRAPWEWDLKRLSASFAVAARYQQYKSSAAEELVYRLVLSYQSRMQAYAGMGMLETWYDQITFDRLLEEEASQAIQKRIRKAMAKASDRTQESLLPKMVQRSDDRLMIMDAPPAVFHIFGRSTLFDPDDELLKIKDTDKARKATYESYLDTLAPGRRELLNRFAYQDGAFKVVGVGSVGTRCMIMLRTDARGNPLFLQFKEAGQSVVARYFKAKGGTRSARKGSHDASVHEGKRVIDGQRLMQAASDLFLGWTSGPLGRHFYVRQLRDMKLSPQVELMDREMLGRYAQTCAWALARAHAKASGQAAEISAYLGRSERMANALTEYSKAYADQVERDYERFAAACRSGKLEARTDEDMAADFRI